MKNNFLNQNKILFIAILLLNIVPHIYSQTIIKGYVLDAKTEKPIHEANVYLLGTLKGRATDNEGNYSIKNPPKGIFYLVASHIGYEMQKIKINTEKIRNMKFIFQLNKRLFELPDVIISGENDEWLRNYKTFKNQFIGVLENSAYTEIMNPYVLQFSETTNGWLKAITNEPINVENNILGYKLNYYLDHFECFYPYSKYSGQPFFIEMNDNASLKEAFSQNRKEVYCGSLRHFLYAAVKQYIEDSLDNKTKIVEDQDSIPPTHLEKQGFKVYTQNMFESIGPVRPIYYPIKMNDCFTINEDSSKIYLKFHNLIRIHYEREVEEKLFLKHIGQRKQDISGKPQISFIELTADSVEVDVSGYSFDSFSIYTRGYMAYDRVARLLPYEYSVSDTVLENYGLRINKTKNEY